MSGRHGPIPGAVFPSGDKKLAGNFKIPKTTSNTTTDPSKASTSGSSARAGSSGTTTDDGFQTVNRRNKGRSSDDKTRGVVRGTASAGNPTNPRSGQTGGMGRVAAAETQIPRAVMDVWKKEGRCYSCGSESHKKSSCPLGTAAAAKVTPSTSASSSKSRRPKGKGASAPKPASSDRGVKRSRDPAPTGQTPPAKKPATKKFSYAEAAANAHEMAIVTKEMGHVSKKDFDKLRTLVEDAWLRQLEEGKEPFEVDQWLYTSQLATFSVPNKNSLDEVGRIIHDQEFLVFPKHEILENRRPTTILTGLVTGPAASRDRTTLERLLKFEAERVGISGRMEYYSSHPIEKSGNLLLKILLDDRAMACLGERKFELRIGASGRVKFSDERADKKTSKAEKQKAEREELMRTFEEQKKAMKESLEKIRALQPDEESVGSMGVSNLSMETEQTETGKQSTVDEDTGSTF